MGILSKKNDDRQKLDQQQQGQPGQGLERQQPRQSAQGELVRQSDPMQRWLRDPFQLMRDLMLDPFGSLVPSRGVNRELIWNPSFEVRETNDAYVFKGDLPGVNIEDVDIMVTGNQLEITGKREHESEIDEGTLHTYERSYGNFRRVFALPESADLDQIRCDLKDGVLRVLVPKRPGTAQQSRRIQIGSGSRS